MIRGVLVCVMLSGCGRIGFQPTTLDGDGGDRDALDAPTGTACPTGPWGNLQHLTQLASTAVEAGPAIHPNGRVLVFHSNRTGDNELYLSQRTSSATPWGAPVQLTSLGSVDSDDAASWSPDGTQLHWHRLGSVNDRMVADYLGGTSFGAPRIDDLPFDGDNATFSANGLELFYSTYNTSVDLGHATRPTIGGPWTTDNDLAGLNSAFETEAVPTFDDARQTLYFLLEMPSATFHVVQTTRADPQSSFGPTSVVSDIDTGGASDPEISRDGLTFLFMSDRASPGDDDLWMATRTCQ